MARRIVSTALVGVVCTGCGPVNLSGMTPEVWKPSALFIENGRWSDWSPANIQTLGQLTQVVTKAVYAPDEGQVLQTMTVAAKRTPDVGLYVVISPMPVDTTVQSFVKAHVSVRVEWVSPSQVDWSPQVNLRTVSQDQQVLAYLGGWLAASIAPSSSIGWDLSQTGSINQRNVTHAALAGAYMANPSFKSQPFMLSQLSSLTVPVNGWPRAVVTDQPIDAVSLSMAALHHVVVVSLVEQMMPTNPFLVDPVIPGPSSIQSDLVQYHSSKWTAGAHQTVFGTVFDISQLGLAGPIANGYNNQVSLVESDATWPQGVWNTVPPDLQKSLLGLFPK